MIFANKMGNEQNKRKRESGDEKKFKKIFHGFRYYGHSLFVDDLSFCVDGFDDGFLYRLFLDSRTIWGSYRFGKELRCKYHSFISAIL